MLTTGMPSRKRCALRFVIAVSMRKRATQIDRSELAKVTNHTLDPRQKARGDGRKISFR
jgi:hypothetical protein